MRPTRSSSSLFLAVVLAAALGFSACKSPTSPSEPKLLRTEETADSLLFTYIGDSTVLMHRRKDRLSHFEDNTVEKTLIEYKVMVFNHVSKKHVDSIAISPQIDFTPFGNTYYTLEAGTWKSFDRVFGKSESVGFDFDAAVMQEHDSIIQVSGDGLARFECREGISQVIYLPTSEVLYTDTAQDVKKSCIRHYPMKAGQGWYLWRLSGGSGYRSLQPTGDWKPFETDGGFISTQYFHGIGWVPFLRLGGRSQTLAEFDPDGAIAQALEKVQHNPFHTVDAIDLKTQTYIYKLGLYRLGGDEPFYKP